MPSDKVMLMLVDAHGATDIHLDFDLADIVAAVDAEGMDDHELACEIGYEVLDTVRDYRLGASQ